MDIGASANPEVVDKFCYLGDTLSVDRDADAAVEARIELDGINSGSWHHCLHESETWLVMKDKNSSGDEIANVNFYAVRLETTRIR